MAVINLSTASPDLFETLGEVPEICFWCSRPLTAQTLVWTGAVAGRNVYLHVGCARRFALAIFRDIANLGRRFDGVAFLEAMEPQFRKPEPEPALPGPAWRSG